MAIVVLPLFSRWLPLSALIVTGASGLLAGLSLSKEAYGCRKSCSRFRETIPFPVQVSFKNTVLYISPKNVQKDAANERVQFQPPAYVPPFKWQPRDGRNPAGGGWNRRFDELLEDDYFIDKSAALYHLIKDYYDVEKRDFRSVPMRLVYPRGFGKTIMLEFIKDVFSPLPELDNYNRNQEMKTKIASLEKGRELFMFGSHPVILLTAPLFFWQVNTWIARGLERAGLVNLVADQTLTPREHLLKGVTRLNAKFEEASGVRTNTIVLIDDYDFFFQDKNLDNSVLAAIMDLYLLGKEQDTGISLMVFSGRSRMVESEVNSYIDVSRKSKYHGLCGFSARELVKCANRQLDGHSKRNYDGQTFEEILQKKFGPEWNKFRFGLDEEIGLLDPTSPEGLLFSPMDAWKLVMFLLNDKKYPPSSAWHDTMGNELEFTSFANRYTSTLKGRYTLYRNLQGGWVDVTDPKFMMMSKQDYLQVGNNLQVKQVFLEAGLLTVKEVDGNMVRLGSPNWTVTKNGLTMLWDKTKQESLPMDLAYYYVSNDGFAEMVSDAAAEVNSMNRGGGESNWCKNSLDEYLFMEMLYRFRDPAIGRSKHDLHRQAPVSLPKERNEADDQNLPWAITLLYDESKTMVLLIKTIVTEILSGDIDSIKAAHQRNVEESKAQVQFYTWQGPKVAKEVWAIVSGVWHPRSQDESGQSTIELSTAYEFVTLNSF